MALQLPNGIYPPVPTFFDERQDLDLTTLRMHLQRLADSGIAGYVLMGSNGEAVHLSNDERQQTIEMARSVTSALFEAGGEKRVLIVGCGDSSTRATIAHCRQAAECGGDFALVIPPSYFRGRMDVNALLMHFRTVADASPLPVLIYNMPANTAGIDLSAQTICTLAEHANIVGVKDSSGNISKIAEVVASVRAPFRVFAGSASFLLPALAVGAAGAVAALANIFPQEVCDVQACFEAEQLDEARTLQASLIPLNDAVTSGYGVAGLKAALKLVAGYGGVPRLPLLPLTSQEHTRVVELVRDVQEMHRR